MSDIVVRRRHRMSLARARRLARAMAERLGRELEVSYTWDGDTLRFDRTGASGQLVVSRDEIELRVELGWLLRPFRSRIEGEIRAVWDEHLG